MKKWIFRFFLVLTAVEGLLTAGILFSSRSDVQGLLFGTGLTGKNLLLLFIVLVMTLLAITLSVFNNLNDTVFCSLTKIVEKDRLFLGVIFASLLVLIECINDIVFLYSNITYPLYYDYIQLLNSILSILALTSLIGIQVILLVLFLRQDRNPLIDLLKSAEYQSVIIFTGLVALLIFFKVAHWGHIPNSNRREISTRFGTLAPTGAPLVWEQVVIIFLLLVILACCIGWLAKRSEKIGRMLNSEILIFFSLWLAAYLIWSWIPIEGNWFVDISSSPLLTVYPSSDSFYFDKEAFNIFLTGEFLSDTIHVMYSFFLMILHQVGGNNYLDFLPFQIAVLAFTPAALYKLVSKLSSKPVGIFISLLYILREANGLFLAGDIDGSLVNQLMSENLAILGIIIFLYFLISWLQNPETNKSIPFIAGGVIGVTLLIRAELITILLAVCFGALIHLWNKKSHWVIGMLKLWVIVFIIITPWMGRNLIRNGYFSLHKAGIGQNLVKRYLDDIFSELGPVFQENDPTVENRATQSEPDPGSNGNDPIAEIQATPSVPATGSQKNSPWGDYWAAQSGHRPSFKTMNNHLASSIWQSILYLPSSHQPLFTVFELMPYQYQNQRADRGLFSEAYIDRYVRSQAYYWYRWDGEIELRSYYAVVVVLICISIGSAALWKTKRNSAFILPLAFLAYIFAYAAAGSSGGRFIKSVDWITLVYYGLGLSIIFKFLWEKIISGIECFRVQNEISISAETGPHRLVNNRAVIITTIGLVLLGLGPTLSELILPSRYSEEILIHAIGNRPALGRDPATDQYAEEILNNPSQPMYGKALYPRYFNENETLPDDRKGTIPDADLARFDFYLIGTQNTWISLPLDHPGQPFPHYSDVVVFGEQKREQEMNLREGYLPYFQAEVIYLIQDDGMIKRINCSGPGCTLEVSQ